jgi:hypothetical protein
MRARLHNERIKRLKSTNTVEAKLDTTLGQIIRGEVPKNY